MGVHFAGEGPDLDQPAPDAAVAGYEASACTLVAFTSPACEICARLLPGLRRLAAAYQEIELRIVDSDAKPEAFPVFGVRSTPYVVAVDGDGVVRSRGVANTLDQVEEMLAEVLARQEVSCPE
jgi:thioredoxin-like negative regulator of GroEL